MTTDERIKEEKMQCDINREVAKTSALPSIYEWRNTTSWSKKRNQVTFAYSPLEKP